MEIQVSNWWGVCFFILPLVLIISVSAVVNSVDVVKFMNKRLKGNKGNVVKITRDKKRAA